MQQILRFAQDFGRRLPLTLRQAQGSLTPPNRLKNKTGAYSPPRFSAPALKVSRNRENQAAHLLPANLFAEQRRVCEIKMDAKLCINKMPCAPEAGQ
jgi:hypothetical protein